MFRLSLSLRGLYSPLFYFLLLPFDFIASPLSLRQRRRGKIDSEALAPHRHGAIFGEIDVTGQIVVLIADIALNAAEIDKARLLHRVVVFGIRRRHEINVHVGTVRSLERAEAQDLLSSRQLVN